MKGPRYRVSWSLLFSLLPAARLPNATGKKGGGKIAIAVSSGGGRETATA
ncbi:MAG: hypothetical protein HY482_01405 [Candidatus Wildermuthbacteria bacterium]|nr:hypothetical protein [Candidatus Wildermuthbacteria bacterium]